MKPSRWMEQCGEIQERFLAECEARVRSASFLVVDGDESSVMGFDELLDLNAEDDDFIEFLMTSNVGDVIDFAPHGLRTVRVA